MGFAGCQGAKMRDEECFPAEHAEHAEREEAPAPLSASFCVVCGLNPCNPHLLCYIWYADLFFEILLARPVPHRAACVA